MTNFKDVRVLIGCESSSLVVDDCGGLWWVNLLDRTIVRAKISETTDTDKKTKKK